MQQGHNVKNLNISCYIYRCAYKFLRSGTLFAPLFFRTFVPSSSKQPFETDISIAQKTCEFWQCDISVTINAHNKLIYQFFVSFETFSKFPKYFRRLPGTELPQSSRGYPFRQSLRLCHLPQGDGFCAVTAKFLAKVQSLRACPLPRGELSRSD